MAHTASLAHGGVTLTDRIVHWIGRVKDARAKAAEYNRTYTELQHLSNRELDDIGVRRCDIADIARKHVYCS